MGITCVMTPWKSTTDFILMNNAVSIQKFLISRGKKTSSLGFYGPEDILLNLAGVVGDQTCNSWIYTPTIL